MGLSIPRGFRESRPTGLWVPERDTSLSHVALALGCTLADADLPLSLVSANWLWEPHYCTPSTSAARPGVPWPHMCVYLSLLLGCTEQRRECQ